MKYLLDSDIIIDFFNGFTPTLDLSLHQTGISVITYGELYYGLLNNPSPKKTFELVDNFLLDTASQIEMVTKEIMKQSIEIQVILETIGKKLDQGDIYIASTAIVHDYTLLTRNVKHFSRIPDLKIWKE